MFSDAGTVIKAATLGVGLAYEAADLMQDELASGRLIPVLENYSHTFPGFHIYYPHRNVSSALRVIIDILRDYPGADSRAIRTADPLRTRREPWCRQGMAPAAGFSGYQR